jgi:crotonobetainyl-CoA:carnitine CoA-transferase CaiB-like acyl-CoA transferase
MSQLEGIKVVDFSRYLSGPTLTMLLADFGADVIKVETLPGGDPARASGPFQDGESVYYMSSNRNKRSLAVDLRRDAGKEIVHRLVASADVVVQNFRPGVMEKMGFGYDTLAAVNSGLIYCGISGFGTEPPGSDFPGFDQTAQAMSGFMSVTGTPETGPLRAGIAVGDSVTGVFGAVGVLAALVRRSTTGRGEQIDASLMGSMLTMMSYQAQKFLSLGVVAGQDGNNHPIMFPQGTFAASDGPITLASGNEAMWRKLSTALGLSDIAEDPRYADNASRMENRDELRRLIEERLATGTKAEWIERINAVGVPSSPVLDLREALEHPFTTQLGMVETVEHSKLGPLRVLGKVVKGSEDDPGWLRRAAPLLGENTVEICRELGIPSGQIDALLEAGTLVQAAEILGG